MYAIAAPVRTPGCSGSAALHVRTLLDETLRALVADPERTTIITSGGWWPEGDLLRAARLELEWRRREGVQLTWVRA